MWTESNTEPCSRVGLSLPLIRQPTSEDITQHNSNRCCILNGQFDTDALNRFNSPAIAGARSIWDQVRMIRLKHTAEIAPVFNQRLTKWTIGLAVVHHGWKNDGKTNTENEEDRTLREPNKNRNRKEAKEMDTHQTKGQNVGVIYFLCCCC